MDGGYASWVRSGLKFKPDEPETAVDVLKKEVVPLPVPDQPSFPGRPPTFNEVGFMGAGHLHIS